MSFLVFVRHGQSEWNAKNLFTGWVDVDLTPEGEAEARSAGRLMTEAGLIPEVLHTSVLKRALHTAELLLEESGAKGIIEYRDWRLNERHYGALQGMNKTEAVEKFGEEQVRIWRRGYAVPPPPLDDAAYAAFQEDPIYAEMGEQLPRSECLADVVARAVPYFESEIAPDLEKHDVVLVVAHGNSLRALAKHLEKLSEDEVTELEIPTGVPRVYELSGNLEILNLRELGDQEAIAKARADTAAQTKLAK